jgi:rhodanese-related sulfurtransferase
VWRRLAEKTDTVLIDVRTRAEWAYVGLPDLTSLGKKTVLVEWQSFPDNRPNPAFVEELSERLATLGASRDTELYFICRSGARSRLAAEAMLGAGFARCYNVAEGFEGPLDDAGHRGARSGWKAQALPWVQS